MLSTFVRYWKKESGEEMEDTRADLIVPISYTTLQNRLTDATCANVELVLKLRKSWYPDARIAFSSCSYPFPGAELVEDRLRTEMCRKAGVEPIVAAPMVNTVDEAMNIREAMMKHKGLYPQSILIVTGELHSPSAKYIWQELFPKARILIRCISYKLEIQPDHLVLDQRTMGKWILSNIKREVALRVLPLSVIRKIQHKAAH